MDFESANMPFIVAKARLSIRVSCELGFGMLPVIERRWLTYRSTVCLRLLESFTWCVMQNCIDASLILRGDSFARTEGCLWDGVISR